LSGPTKLAYNPALDGLRALAVAAVLCFHGDWAWARGGFLGVSAFFTLSGFLITKLLLAESETQAGIDLRRFWTRRLRRLMPAALLGLSGVVVGALVIEPPGDPRQFVGDVMGSLTYVANWRFIATGQDYAALFREASPVQHFWSLGIEEQFYLFYPVLLLVVLRSGAASRRKLGWILGMGAILSTGLAAFLYVPGDPIVRAYYGTDTRVAELLVGALLALWLSREREQSRAGPLLTTLGGASLVAVLASWALADTAAPLLYRGGLLAHAVAVACLLAAISCSGPLRSLLGIAPLRFVGWISYGLYVYHWPIYQWLDAERTGLPPVPLFALRLLVTVAVATASYYSIERPVRHGFILTGRRAALSGVGSVILLMALLGIGRAQWSEAGVWATEPMREDEAIEFEDELPGVLVVGDSLSLNLGRALADWGLRTRRASFASHGMRGCPIALGGEVVVRAGPIRQRTRGCSSKMNKWRTFVDEHEPDVIVVLAGGLDLFDRRLDGWNDFLAPGDAALDEWLVSEYTTLGRSLTSGGAELVWLTWPCAIQRGDGMFSGTHALDTSRVRILNEQILPRVQSELGGVMHIVDLFEPLCPGGKFSRAVGTIADGRIDGLHLSRPAASWVADWLGPRILAEAGIR